MNLPEEALYYFLDFDMWKRCSVTLFPKKLRFASCFSELPPVSQVTYDYFFGYEGIPITLPLKYITDTLNTDTSILETFKLYKSYISKQYTKIQTRIKKG